MKTCGECRYLARVLNAEGTMDCGGIYGIVSFPRNEIADKCSTFEQLPSKCSECKHEFEATPFDKEFETSPLLQKPRWER